jgi:hypothetical protein
MADVAKTLELFRSIVSDFSHFGGGLTSEECARALIEAERIGEVPESWTRKCEAIAEKQKQAYSRIR